MNTKIKSLIEDNPLRLVGLKQVSKGIIDDKLWCVILSSDSDDFIKQQIADSAKPKSGLTIEYIDSKEDLGKLVGIDVPAAVVGLVKKS